MPRSRRSRFVVAVLLVVLPACGGGGGGGDEDQAPAPAATAAISTPTPTLAHLSTPTPEPSPTGPVAWAAGGNSLIRSDDGGFVWTATDRGATALAFADRDVGWIVGEYGPGFVLRTADGGRTWVDQIANIVGVPPVLHDVAAGDRSHAIAVGGEPRISTDAAERPATIVTDDGGATWRIAELPLDPGVTLLSTCLGPSGLGLAAGSSLSATDATLLLLTHDAGRSWEPITDRLPRRSFANVGCGPDGRLWFLGRDSTVRMSADGGLSWEDRHGNLPAGLSLRHGAFVAGNVAWIAATEPPLESQLLVFLTADGGQTWTQHLVDAGPREFAAIGLDALDATHAVIVAQDVRPFAIGSRSSFGRSWVTVDGGTTWSATEHPEPINALWDVALLP